jgi:hypothetical protein
VARRQRDHVAPGARARRDPGRRVLEHERPLPPLPAVVTAAGVVAEESRARGAVPLRVRLPARDVLGGDDDGRRGQAQRREPAGREAARAGGDDGPGRGGGGERGEEGAGAGDFGCVGAEAGWDGGLGALDVWRVSACNK